MALIDEPRRVNPLLRLGIWVSERVTGRRMEPARLLAWYPKAALGAGVLESLVAHDTPSARLLALVRVTASVTAACPFCVDMNSYGVGDAGVTEEELRLLQTGPEASSSFTERERTAIAYARAISSTPLFISDELKADIVRHFTERDIVVLVTTAAQVNFWARTIQGLGIAPAGFCTLPTEGRRTQK